MLYRLDIIPVCDITGLDIKLNIGFQRASATGVACRQGTLTPPDTWSCPFGTCICCLDQSFSELVIIFPDYALRISLVTFSILLDGGCALHQTSYMSPSRSCFLFYCYGEGVSWFPSLFLGNSGVGGLGGLISRHSWSSIFWWQMCLESGLLYVSWSELFLFYLARRKDRGRGLISILINLDLGWVEGLIAWHNWRSIHDGGCAWHQTS